MIQVTVNGKKEFAIGRNSLNGASGDWDLIKVRENIFHVIRHNQSYYATLISYNVEEKMMTINVNGNDYEVSIKDKSDLLLQQLGINSNSLSAIHWVKAPMPGLIIAVSAKTGDEIRKGDPLLILEAMKMENAIKSPRDGKIKKVNVQLKQPVEKNQMLVEFE